MKGGVSGVFTNLIVTRNVAGLDSNFFNNLPVREGYPKFQPSRMKKPLARKNINGSLKNYASTSFYRICVPYITCAMVLQQQEQANMYREKIFSLIFGKL